MTVKVGLRLYDPRKPMESWEADDLALVAVPRVGETVVLRDLEGYVGSVYATVTAVDWWDGGPVELVADIDHSMSMTVEQHAGLDTARAAKFGEGVKP